MEKIIVAIHSFGNIGRYALDAVLTSPDCRCVGVIRRPESVGKSAYDLRGVPDYPSLDALLAAKERPQVILVAAPSRKAPDDAAFYLEKGFHTVDSFDIHPEIPGVVKKLHESCRKGNSVAITAAGWDPGTDSVFRAYFEAMAPVGTTFTNFGRGRSMGHSVAAREHKGVADATSITIPMGGGRHSRLVYVLLEKGAVFENVRKSISEDPYFTKDPLEVRQAGSQAELDAVCDASHGVAMERVGASGSTSNQHLTFDMRINNPALTAQVMVSCARACLKMPVGCHTLIDVPPVYLLPGDRMEHIARLV